MHQHKNGKHNGHGREHIRAQTGQIPGFNQTGGSLGDLNDDVGPGQAEHRGKDGAFQQHFSPPRMGIGEGRKGIFPWQLFCIICAHVFILPVELLKKVITNSILHLSYW